MKKILSIFLWLFFFISILSAQPEHFKTIGFIIGNWEGAGSGFGNSKSVIKSSFTLIMDDKYIEVKNESRFEPTEKNPKGDHHIDKGFISFDKARNKIVYRQFNNEGYINQYILNDTLSNDSVLVFDTESIENFVAGGKARWTIKRIADDKIETIFDVSFSKGEYACFGTNVLLKKEE